MYPYNTLTRSKNQSECKEAIRHAALLFVIIFGLYLFTRSHHYSADSILYAMRVESGDVKNLIDPAHLLLHPLAWGFYQICQALGRTGTSLLPMQILNALGGAAATALVYMIVHSLTKSWAIAYPISLGFAVSGATWLLSIEAEFVTIPLAFKLLVLYVILSADAARLSRPRFAVMVGLLIAAAMATYLNSFFLLIVASITWLMADQLRPSLRIRQIVMMASITGMSFGPLLLTVSRWGHRQTSLWQQINGPAYSPWSWLKIPHGMYAFLRTLALYPKLAMNTHTRDYLNQANALVWVTFTLYYLLVLVIALLPVFIALRKRKLLWATHRRTMITLATWTALYAAFAVYWVPGDISFWIPVLVVWWILVGLIAATNPTIITRWLWAGVILIGGVNATLSMVPRHNLSLNYPYHIATHVASETDSDDLILVGNDSMLALYLPYFAARRALAVNPLSGQSDHLSTFVHEQIATTLSNKDQVFIVVETQTYTSTDSTAKTLDPYVLEDYAIRSIPSPISDIALIFEVRQPR